VGITSISPRRCRDQSILDRDRLVLIRSVNCILTLFKSIFRTFSLDGEDGYARAGAVRDVTLDGEMNERPVKAADPL